MKPTTTKNILKQIDTYVHRYTHMVTYVCVYMQNCVCIYAHTHTVGVCRYIPTYMQGKILGGKRERDREIEGETAGFEGTVPGRC